MRSFRSLNNLVGWLVFAIAFVTYLLTLEPTASFWDCGEFIACAYKLLVPHPPGAPTFLLLGRVLSLFSFGDVTKVAVLINALSGLSSAFTVLFLFWIITHLARKLLLARPDFSLETPEPSRLDTFLILGAGAVGALAFAFSDSFWFNAVEGEVYAMSALCTAAVVWIIMKWEARADQPDSDKWLILIAYVIGLSIGVHLLNLLTLPALGLIYYFRRSKNPSLRGGAIVLVVSMIIVGSILVGIIPGLPTLAGAFEVFFVNSVGLPFSGGLIVFLIVFVGLTYLGFRLSFQRRSQLLNTAMLCFLFILIGYSSYLIVPIRANYKPTINENDPSDVLSFVSYLKREQYGSRPLLYGPQFNAQPESYAEGAPRYTRNIATGKYDEILPRQQEPVYRDEDKMLLPRLYSYEPAQIAEYQKWVDIQQETKPTMGQNLSFMARYQMGHMFWRYFMWNYVGRESDVQQAGVLTPFSPGRNSLPPPVAQSMARNNFLAIPLILGIFGLFFQARRRGQDALIVGLLFLMTGLAIVIYLNQPPSEPRERDYTFTGATFAFAIWIGLGVLGIADLLRSVLKADGLRTGAAVLLGLIAPGIMVAQGWDDHNRSNRYNSVDSAKNLLDSCAPNAVLFTNGDNDTFPLWYVQEVEGYRTDVRVAVTSYLNTDWYIAQMKRRAYKSDPLPISMDAKAYVQGNNDVLYYAANPAVKELNLNEFIGLVNQASPLLRQQYGEGGPEVTTYPTNQFFMNVDTAAVKKLGLVPKGREKQLVARLDWSMGKRLIEKKNLVILDMIATNNWQRPIYFSSTINPSDYMNLQPYFQLEGMAYRLLPFKDPNYDPRGDEGYVALDLNYQKLMQQYSYRGLNNPKIFYDENNLRFPANYRDKFARLATAYLQAGDTAKAREVAVKCLALMPDEAIPFDVYTPQLVPALVAGGEKARANQIMDLLTDRASQMLSYYATRPDAALFDNDQRGYLVTLNSVGRAAEQVGDKARSQKAIGLLQQFYPQQ
ncbi:protein O-mannosyl-transferase family [uncultured Hymenobacter sp.]|uniref:glycosyltransferase family 117 protein n=1 Tax=uncultured Hymenobacter sp. TaxID=170016 RepID=UPI0035C9BEEB